MSNNSFQVYLESVTTMAQTMVVKSNYIANRINERLLHFLEYETDLERPETWKYYMNLAGEYHPTDTVMSVISSDNLEEIIFRADNLKRHRRTARDYQFGTRQYGELLARYPGQEDVILGILYPTDKAAAIEAADHKILRAHPTLLESNEYTLIEELQRWTDIYFKRYYNEQYTISDSLYYGVVLSMYYMNLVPAILTARLKRHKTAEAHSFYVRQYLASHSDLGKYHPFMNLPQSMHFYRNIRYYQRHAGKNDTMGRLIENLLTKRNLPIASYSLRHDHEEQTDSIYPLPLFKRTDLTKIPSSGAPEYIFPETLLRKEIPDAPGNSLEVDDAEAVITQRLKDSPANVVLTKVLESAVVDYSKAVTYQLEDIQVSHWLYYASKNIYAAVISLTNPKNNERMVLTSKDAYILAMYAMFMSFEMEPTEIPLMAARRVQRYPEPIDDDIKSIVDMKYIDDFTWETAKNSVVPIDVMISVDSFYDTTFKLFRAANFQRDLVSYQEGMHARGETFKLVSRFWADAYVRLAPKGASYNAWIVEKNLNFDGYKQNDWQQLYEALIQAALGADLATVPSLRNTQRAMVNAMKDLSSYTIQLVSKIADEKLIMANLPSVRVGNQDVYAENHEQVRLGYFDVHKQTVSGVHFQELDINIFSEMISHEVQAKSRIFIDLQNGPRAPDRGFVYYHRHPLSRVEIAVLDKPDTSGTPLQPILGMGYYMAMSDAEQASLFE